MALTLVKKNKDDWVIDASGRIVQGPQPAGPGLRGSDLQGGLPAAQIQGPGDRGRYEPPKNLAYLGTSEPYREQKGIFGKIADAGKAFVKGVTEPYEYLGEALGTAAQRIPGLDKDLKAAEASREALDQMRVRRYKQINDELRNPATDPEKRARLEREKAGIREQQNVDWAERGKEFEEFQQKTDPTRAAASVLSIGSDIATLGVGTGFTQAAKQAAKQGGKKALAKELVVQGAKSGAAAVPAGALSPVVSKGKEATAGDMALGGLIGFAAGGLLPGGAYGASRGASRLAARVSPRAAERELVNALPDNFANDARMASLRQASGEPTPTPEATPTTAVRTTERGTAAPARITPTEVQTPPRVSQIDNELNAQRTLRPGDPGYLSIEQRRELLSERQRLMYEAVSPNPRPQTAQTGSREATAGADVLADQAAPPTRADQAPAQGLTPTERPEGRAVQQGTPQNLSPAQSAAIEAYRATGDVARAVDAYRRSHAERGLMYGGDKQSQAAVERLIRAQQQPTGLTQRQQVARVLADKDQATVKEIAEETRIKEPNIRRIVGDDIREGGGVFERVDKGVYRITTADGRVKAFVETANAMESLPRLANEGFKADMMFLDLPYDLKSVKGGNRGVKYDLIKPEQYRIIADAAARMMRTPDSHVYMMINNAPSDRGASEAFVDVLRQAGFQVVAEGRFTKMTKDGTKRATNVRGKPQAPERVILLTQSGTAVATDVPVSVDFTLPRVNRAYPTEKPAGIAEQLVKQSTREGDMVVDPFAGSGVVGDEAVKAGRSAYLIERSPEAVEDFIKPRLQGTFEKFYGVKQKTVENLVDRYGEGATRQILERSRRATGIRNKDAFVTAEARKQFGGGRVKLSSEPVEAGETMGEGRFSPVQVKRGVGAQVKEAFLDRDAVILDTLRRMERQAGVQGFVDQFMYDSGLQSRANSIANAKMRTNTNLRAALSGLNKRELAEFNEYAAARSEMYNASEGMQTSRPVEELQAVLDQYEAKYADRFANLNRYYNDLAKDAYEGGLISKERYEEFIANPDYIRTQRNFDDLINRPQGVGNAYSLGQTITRHGRKGSAREMLPADQVAFDYTQQLQKEIQRNQTANNLINSLEIFGMARQLLPDEAVHKNTIKRIVDGNTEIFEIDPEIKRVVDNVRPYELNILEKIVGFPARVLRAGATALSAPFTIANYLKDQVGSGVYSAHVAATHHPAHILAGLWQASRDQLWDTNDELWLRFIAHAGDTTQYDLTRNVRSGRVMSRELRRGKAGRVGNAMLHPIRTLEDLNSITEKATRFQNFKGTYQDLMKKGFDEQEAFKRATLAAWQNSVDFNRAGDWARVLNLLIPYFNAGIQGTRTMARSFKQRPIATSMKALSYVSLPLLGLTAYNMADAKRREIYDNISEYEKENNFILIPPNTEQNADGTYDVWKIPMPLGINNLANPLRRAYESFTNQEDLPGVDMAQDVIKALSGPIDFRSVQQFAGSMTPQAVKPMLQQAANKNFFTGKEIVPEYINEDLDANGNPIPDEKKVYDHTSGVSRKIGEMLGVSPIRVDQFIKDTFAKVGQYTQHAVDTGLAKAGKIPEEQIGGVSIPADISRRFTKVTSNYNFKKSDAAKHFDDVEAELAGMSKADRDAWEAIHPRRTNTLGEEVSEKTILDSVKKVTTYLNHPEVLEADRRIDKRARDRGLPGNPLFDLNPEQLQKVLTYRSAKLLNAGKQTYDKNGNPLFTALDLDEKWYDDFRNAESAFYKTIGADDKESENKIPTFSGVDKPKASDDLQARMDHYYTLPKGTGARKAFLAANPDILDYWKQTEAFTNEERAKLGLDPIESESFSSGSGGSGGGRRAGRARRGGGGSRGPRINMRTYSGSSNPAPAGRVKVKTPAKAKAPTKKKAGKVKLKREKLL